MEKAIDRMAADGDVRQQMEIYASLALSRMFTEGNSERVRDAFDSALRFAEQREDGYQQLRLLSGLSMYCHRRIDVAGSLELALRGQAVAKKTGSPDDVAIANSMLGAAYYMRGEQRRRNSHLERALQSAPPLRRFNATQYLFDLRTTSLFNLTRSYWFTGNLDRAVGYAKMTIEEAARSDHPIALSRALILTMPLYFWIDDLQQVDKNLSRLELTAEKHSLMPFRAVALGLKGQYLIRTGHAMDRVEHLRDSLAKLALQRLRNAGDRLRLRTGGEPGDARRTCEALSLVDKSIAIQVKFGRPLHLPALFLAKGLAFASGDMPDIRSVEECLREAMRLARQRSTLSFELRAGLELARVWIDRGEVSGPAISLSPSTGNSPKVSRRLILLLRRRCSNRQARCHDKLGERASTERASSNRRRSHHSSVGGDQAQRLRARHGLGAPFNAQLGEHVLEMCLHGLGTDIEVPSNFLVRHSLRDQFEDVGFTGA